MKAVANISIVVSLIFILSACASAPPMERAGVSVNTLYKISYSDLDSSLYIKFLPPVGEKQGLLFATYPNDKPVEGINAGDTGVFEQDWYHVSDDGRVSFRYYEKGNFRTLVQHHPYFVSGNQSGDTSSFRYRIDFSEAEIVSR